jgi:hypothetical protein
MSDIQTLIDNLNNDNLDTRLESLKALMIKINSGEIERPKTGDDINNHIHTNYSFSPYSPTKALWLAYTSGLKTAGIVDHDSISGANEFIKAGEIIGMATTIGVECRVDMSSTSLNGRRINNTDQNSVAYMVLHGVPHTMIDSVTNFFKPFIEKRNIRNKKMVANINKMLESFGIQMDFEKDVVPLSQYNNGGSITERHLSLALSDKLISRYGKGRNLVAFLKNELKLDVNQKMENYLTDPANPFYEYDLLGFIKSDFISSFFIDATDECPNVKEVLTLSNKIGAISAYAYLGDVVDSVTGDKKTQKFEDDYINELFEVIHSLGFNAVTYMPPRNTHSQLSRVKSMCEAYGFFQISGVDINSPRQSFVCEEMKSGEFKNLKDSTWALIGHEISATEDKSKGMFSDETILKYPELNERINVFKEIGLNKCFSLYK